MHQGLPVPEPSGSQEPVASPSLQNHQLYTYPFPPHQEQRSQSPVSPIVTPPDESVPRSSYSPSHYRNGNPQPTANNGNGHSSSMPRRSSSSSHPSNSPTTPKHQQLQLQHQHLFQAQQQPPLQQQMQHPPTASGSSNGRTPDIQRQAKPKRLKAHTVTSKSFSIPMVPRDKKGRPMLPLNVGIMTVISLGEVCMREHFHTERYIFPVGYEVTRWVFSFLTLS
jgi:F/Y-rich N-terminus